MFSSCHYTLDSKNLATLFKTFGAGSILTAAKDLKLFKPFHRTLDENLRTRSSSFKEGSLVKIITEYSHF